MINIFITASGRDKRFCSSKGGETKFGLLLLLMVTAVTSLKGNNNIAMDIRRVSNVHLFCVMKLGLSPLGKNAA